MTETNDEQSTNATGQRVDDEIEITPDMIKAGVMAVENGETFDSHRELVIAIYKAMRCQEREQVADLLMETMFNLTEANRAITQTVDRISERIEEI